jgi:transglutaminase-like putative cysteine protease
LIYLDFGRDAGVAVKPPIKNAADVNHAVYRVRAEGLRPQQLFASGLSQQVIGQDEDVALVTVKKVTPDEPAVVDVDVEGPRPEDKQPSRLVQCDDTRVAALADAVAGTVSDPWRAALLLEHYLFSTLGKVDFSQVFSSAAEVLRRRQGDCSEHAVLLAAVCRARGIPARVVIGLVYTEADQRFLYHMWNEVWIRDRWIPLDATLGRGGIGATHLKLRDSSLADQSAYGIVAPVLHLIGRLEIEVVSSDAEPP